MTWREAFQVQARSDYRMFGRLNSERVEYCHQLHYLQMATEKLAKAITINPQADAPPVRAHVVLVNMLRVIRGRREYVQRLGFKNREHLRRCIDSLLPVADQIQRLAPAGAGQHGPNPEYPWSQGANGPVQVPSTYEFAAFDPKTSAIKQFRGFFKKLIDLDL